jgi:hypothetical protein
MRGIAIERRDCEPAVACEKLPTSGELKALEDENVRLAKPSFGAMLDAVTDISVHEPRSASWPIECLFANRSLTDDAADR